MPHDASKSPAPPTASLVEMQRATDEIGRLVHEIRAVQSAMRVQLLLGSVVLVAVMVVFGIALFAKMRDNLAGDKIQEAVTRRLGIVLPVAADRIKSSVHSVLPQYQALARQRVTAIAPVLQARLQQQLEQLPQQLAKDVDLDLQNRIKTTSDFAGRQVKATFPGLGADPAQDLAEKFEKAMAIEADKLSLQLRESFDTELSRFRAVLEKFPSPDVANTDADALTRRLLHALIMLVDYHVLWGETPGPVATAAPAPVPAPRH